MMGEENMRSCINFVGGGLFDHVLERGRLARIRPSCCKFAVAGAFQRVIAHWVTHKIDTASKHEGC